MDKVLDEVDELVELIKNNPKYKSYLELKKRILENEEIMHLINEVKKTQKEIVRKGKDEELENKITSMLEELDNYPIYVEFNELQKELNFTFQTIKREIENCINSITN